MSGARDRQSVEHPAASLRTAGESPVERAFRVLQTVVAAGESVGVLELGRRTGLPRSTVSRLIATLTELGMVARTADGLVLPGSALATLQTPSQTDPLLEDTLRPLLTELVMTFGENAALSIDDGGALLYLTQVSSDHAVSVPDVSGQFHDFHLVAPGLVTMAHWESPRLTAYLRGTLAQTTDQSMTSSSEIRSRLDTIRDQGWCWTNQELDVGVNGLGFPVWIEDALVATISLFGPSYRLNPDALPDLASEVTALISARSASLL